MAGALRGVAPNLRLNPQNFQHFSKILHGADEASRNMRLFSQVLPTIDNPRALQSWSKGLVKLSDQITVTRDALRDLLPASNARARIVKALRELASDTAINAGAMREGLRRGDRAFTFTPDAVVKAQRGAELIEQAALLLRRQGVR